MRKLIKSSKKLFCFLLFLISFKNCYSLNDSLADQSKPILSFEELKWLRKNVFPLKSVDPSSSSNDLIPLQNIISNSKIIALGEVSHGSSEIFMLKHRIIKYLKENMGFNTFAMEANMPEAYKINDYILKENGDPKVLLNNMRFWTWKTEEVLNLVEWMKTSNNSSSFKIKFTGFDMQFFQQSIIELKGITQRSQEKLLDNLYSKLSKVKKNSEGDILISQEQKNNIEKDLNKLKKWIKDSVQHNEAVWGAQNIRIIEQYIDPTPLLEKRDNYMAENLKWIVDQENSKTIIWAHNNHIKNAKSKMGSHLKKEYVEDYLNIGFAFYSGSYNAFGDGSVKPYKAQEAYPGTYEYILNSIDEPIFLLDLRTLQKNSKLCKWLYENKKFRLTGARKLKEEFGNTPIYDNYDVILFIKESTPTHLLKN